MVPVPEPPPSASEHPPAGRFDFPIYHAETQAAWRAWLERHHADTRGVWLASWKPRTGRPAVPYETAVEEALCFGWIDSTAVTLDDDRGMQLMTPRRPRSSWTRLNRRRVARLEEQGRMTDAGRHVVALAQRNGWWLRYDPVEDLLEPDDLAAALDAVPQARTHWDAFPPSARKPLLWWVISAVRDDTRERRITKIVAEAAEGRRALG